MSDADQMEVDEAKVEEQDEESGPGAATPDRTSDDETEDEDGPGGKTPAPPALRTREKSSGPARSSSKAATLEEAGPPPPRRELPFGRPATRSKPARKQPAPPAEDDETEDEEL